MTTMIERVARALASSDWGDADKNDCYYRYARVAIEEMREPTEEMKKAVRLAGGGQALAYANAAWPTMIDAALNEDADAT